MRVLPSIPAAIVTGAVVVPVFLWGCDAIEGAFGSQLLVLAWAVLAFSIPVLLSTVDVKHVIQGWREHGLFRARASREDFRQLYFPAWIRMGVLFVSAVLSVFALKAMGLML